MAPSPSSATTSVQVALRIRPPTTQDSTSIPARFQRPVIHATSATVVTVEATSNVGTSSGGAAQPAPAGAPKKQLFSFDQVHGPPTTQHALFTSTALPLVSRFLEGFNCTILAYGQTSSGKTFTMTGIDLDADPSDPNNGMGIVPRAVSTIFSRAKKLKDERAGTWNYSVKGSFIEIYNEDLIDLLSMDDPSGGRREVQIREDKDGHIIWGGLREVSVKNSSEVMTLIRKGTSIRRTNETDMNAQSSRSHAIFSLTLTQKKFSGSGAPPRSSSPLPPSGRATPSRLARPGSVYSGGAGATGNRVGSPTFGRSPTPSFASAMGRGGGLRPSSALGHAGDRAIHGGDDEAGEWVTIVSKFHFVDLAGSERLKRTAAAGERIKEGISINSGLLALGNVISALGDPARAKSHTSTHVPYRDSKLTRLLQDSLGGNAHTLMIACVSPAEWNAGETINTLKYANRARNIKNRAVVNEKEDGWDDLEWLQGTITRLRKELKGIKEGAPLGLSSNSHVPEVLEGAGKKVLAQMTELQNNYEDLREKFVERTEELTRLRRELGESHRGSSGATGGTGKYEEIVGPVIEEYEKTIATMEAELSLNRAALRHTNEMVEEKEEELATISDRHAATELYVEELRARVAKLTEREASTEAYVRDLEEKMKSYDETSISSSGSITDLKREVAKFKDTESHSAKYIADLEARLARSDESIVALQQTIEKLERESERRRDEAEILQSRLETLRLDGESWRSDLEERERRVKELEDKMEQWERKKQAAGDARVRLGGVVNEVAAARRSLQVDLESASSSPTEEQSAAPLDSTPIPPAETPDDGLSSQFVALQQTHTATLADLSSMTAKYRDALREISDLAAQIQEAKLSNLESTDSPIVPETPLGRRMTSGKFRGDASDQQHNNAGRRLFFRQAASTESLRGRSLSQSQSLSQELSSVHSRKTSFSSYGTNGSHSPSNSLPGSATHLRPNLSISLPSNGMVTPSSERSALSLEKEIMRLQEVLREREAEISVLENSLKEARDEHISPTSSKSASQLNGNAEAPIVNLSPKTINQFADIRKSMEINGNGHANDPQDTESEKTGSVFSETDESLDRLNELMLSMAQKESNHRVVVDDLTGQLTQLRRQLDDLTALSRDQAVNMSSEIEALTRKHIADLETLEEVKQREADLAAELEQAQVEHAEAMDKLRSDHEEVLKSLTLEHDAAISQLKEEHAASFNAVQSEASTTTSDLQKALEEHRIRANEETEAALVRAREEHAAALEKVASEHAEIVKQKEAESSATLHQTEEDYYNVLTKLRADHAETLVKQAAEAAASLERLKEEHAGEVRMAEIAREGSLSESQSSRTKALQELRDEHTASMARKEASFAEDLEVLKSEHSRALTTKDEDHTVQREKLRAEHDSLVAKLKEEWRIEGEQLNAAIVAAKSDSSAASIKIRAELEASMDNMREQQAELLREVENSHKDELSQLQSSHEIALQTAKSEAQAHLTALSKSHTEDVAKLKSAHQAAITKLNNSMVALQEEHNASLEKLRSQHELTLSEEKSRLSETLEDLKRQHSAERDTLRQDHDLIFQELEAHKVAADEFTLLREQTRQSHEQALEQKTDTVKRVQRQLAETESERDDFASEVARLKNELSRTRNEQSKLIQEASKRDSLVGELERHRSVLADLQENLQKVKDEKDTLQTEKLRSDTLVRELQAQMAQIARSASPPAGGARPPNERNLSYTRVVPGMKLPPPTPPPSVPPPPAPRSAPQHQSSDLSISSHSSGITSSSSRDSQQPDSPITSAGHQSVTPTPTVTSPDPKVTLRIEQQAKQLDEQEAMIKTLNKQLTHCESDLQTHMDLVSTLETSLGDSEKNLRKARMHATELARERDTLNTKLEALRTELAETKREVVTVRKSIVEEKQSYEQRLDEERKAKERARQQLDTRMDELTLKRKSKFACL
ncbi:kinesin domain-containing protein [Mycena floridula]|nr:kinesin domain-containing protein [Mycena floridula]